MQKSGFFNSLKVDGEYDRKYNANDYCDNLAVVIGNGVLRSANDDLKVTASGMIPTVAAGRAWIEGHYYLNDSSYTFPAVTSPLGGNRYDRIMLRLDKNIATRSVSLVYVQGVAAVSPAKPTPVRTENVYDIVLADIYVAANATSISIVDTRADSTVCGWVYATTGNDAFFKTLDNNFNEWFEGVRDELSSVTLFKRYTWTETLSSNTSAVAFNIPQYDAETCFLEVYVNGILDSRHSIVGNVITFVGTLVAGTKVTVNCYKSIDGTGIMSVSDEITALQNQVETIIGTNKFSYRVSGLNDNIALSQIAQALYTGSYTVGSLSSSAEAFLNKIGGNAYLSSMPNGAQVEIDVIGSIYANVPFSGAGTAENRYKFFAIGSNTSTTKKVVFNFSKCERIYVQCANNTFNTVFGGVDVYVKNLNIYATSNGGGCSIALALGVSGSKYNFSDSELTVVASNQAVIANTGNFTNCKCTTKGATLSRCFDVPTFGFVRVNGGTFYAYGGTGTSPTIFYITTGADAGLIMAYNINTPIAAQTGYIQQSLGIIYGGQAIINGVVNYSLAKTGGSRLVVTNEVSMNKAI